MLVLLVLAAAGARGQENETDVASSNPVAGNATTDQPPKKEEPKKDCTFVCPENRGNYADPCTCRRFYICSTDGAAHRSFCPNGLYWDDEKK